VPSPLGTNPACAAFLPERIASAGVMAGVTDVGGPAPGRLRRAEAALIRIGDQAAAVRSGQEHYGPGGSKFRRGAGELAPADLALLGDQATAAVSQ
jgi:hypothetical protein